MVSDPPDADKPGASDEPLIFMSDASAEAERLMHALRERGYSVVDVPLSLLVGRVAVQRPALILCDVDSPGALDQVKRLRDVPGGGQIDIVFFGEAGRTLDQLRDEVFHESSGFFVRPVDTFGLLRKVEALIGAPSSPGARGQSTPASRPPSALSVRPPSSPEPAVPKPDSLRPQARAPNSPVPEGGPSSLPPANSSAPPLRVSSSPPAEPLVPKPIPLGFAADADAAAAARRFPQSDISPELEGILARAEKRVGGASSSPAPASLRMTPEAEVEAVLPADVLAALDEPLDVDDEEDEDAGTGHGTSTGGSVRTGFGTGVGTTGGGLGTNVGSSSGNVGANIIMPAQPVGMGQGAAGPTAVPPRRAAEDAGNAAAPVFGSEEEAPPTPPAVPTRPPEPPSWPPAAASTGVGAQLTNVEPKPMSLRLPLEEGETTAGGSATPLPPAPTPESLRLHPPPSAPVLPRLVPAAPTNRAAPVTPEIPPTLGRGDAAVAMARAVRSRFSGALAFENEQGIRRIVLRDGDFVTVASSVTSETLVAFLTERGTLGPEVIRSLGHKLPPFGRHAGAALIAHGHLRQDELWPVLRAHAEWLVGRVIGMQSGAASIEKEVPARLQAEPAVFGGATGAEVFVEVVRRVVSRDEAMHRIGSARARLVDGPAAQLLGECALAEAEVEIVNRAKSNSLEEVVGTAGRPDFAAVLYALTLLGVLDVLGPAPPSAPISSGRPWDPLDDQALRTRILARKALVEEGDYFALLGLPKNATGYDVQRAYAELRNEFDPSRILTPATASLRDDVDLIIEVLEEAFEILRDQLRRERYRRALEATPQ